MGVVTERDVVGVVIEGVSVGVVTKRGQWEWSVREM